MEHEEFQYLNLIRKILDNGSEEKTRNGITKVLFGETMRFSLKDGIIPILTTKKTAWKTCLKELLWFIRGSTSNRELKEQKVNIWNQNSSREFLDSRNLDYEEGDLGPIYGFQWRNWNNEGIDQIEGVIKSLKTNPNSRRILVTAWNPSVLPDTSKSFSKNILNGKAALPPCHAFFQFYVSNSKLSCQLYQRSADVFLGVPFNIASYSLLTMMVAQVCGLEVGEFIHSFGDVHIYSNHIDQVELQLRRKPKKLPTIKINKTINEIFQFTFDDFELIGYNPHPPIKAPVSV